MRRVTGGCVTASYQTPELPRRVKAAGSKAEALGFTALSALAGTAGRVDPATAPPCPLPSPPETPSLNFDVDPCTPLSHSATVLSLHSQWGVLHAGQALAVQREGEVALIGARTRAGEVVELLAGAVEAAGGGTSERAHTRAQHVGRACAAAAAAACMRHKQGTPRVLCEGKSGA